MKALKKITTKIMGFTKPEISELCLKNKKTVHPLYHVVGTVVSASIVESEDPKMPDYVELMGDFKAIAAKNAVNDNTSFSARSGKWLPPEVAGNMIASAILSAKDGDSSRVIQTAVTITAEYDEGFGYRYGADFHTKEQDSFAELEALIPALQIEASKKKK